MVPSGLAGSPSPLFGPARIDARLPILKRPFAQPVWSPGWQTALT